METTAGTKTRHVTESDELLEAVQRLEERFGNVTQRVKLAAQRITYGEANNPADVAETRPQLDDAAPPFTAALKKRINALHGIADELEGAAEHLEKFR